MSILSGPKLVYLNEDGSEYVIEMPNINWEQAKKLSETKDTLEQVRITRTTTEESDE